MKKILLYLILFVAVGMAGIVAYVSISGLLKVFAGAGTIGLMFFSAIEIAKIVATSTIHTYGNKIKWLYKGLLSLMIVIAMAITSMGIYGFLSSSYKASFAKMENIDSQIELMETKRNGYQEQLTFVTEEKTTLNKTIGELSSGLSNNIIQYKDPVTGEIITTTSSSTRRALEKQLDNAIIRQTTINAKADSVSTIIFDLDNKILETKLGNDAANELGTLKYLSDITGMSMDEVMKWFIFILIIIGDPMAIIMVIVFNKIVKKDDDAPNDTPKIDNHPPVVDDKVDDDDDDDDELFDILPIMVPNEVPEDIITLIHDEPLDDESIEFLKGGSITDGVTEEIPEEVEDLANEISEKLNRPVTIREITPDESPELVDEIDLSPEDQIEENIDEVQQLKREPIIPRGKIIEQDLKKDRGFSVDVPDPQITRVGSNKEIRDKDGKKVFFKRKRGDELTNE